MAPYLHWITVVVVAMVLVGCATPVGPIHTFAIAAESVAADAHQGYLILDESLKKKQIYEAALHPEQPISAEIFEGILTENQRMESRTELLKHLAEYATSLECLWNKDFKKAMKADSTSLTNVLFHLKESYEAVSGSKIALTKADLGLMANLAADAGSAYMELRRKELLKIIVQKADPAVQQVVLLLRNEFMEIGPVVERELKWVETALEKGYNQDAARLDYQKRIEMLTQIQVAHDNAATAGKLFVTLGGVVSRMGKAHANLVVALEKNEMTTQEFVAAVEDLVQQAQAVKTLIKGLK